MIGICRGQRLVSEIRTHGLLSSDAELASLLVGSRDDLIQNALEKARRLFLSVINGLSCQREDLLLQSMDHC
eukprot:g550.t1